MNVIVITDVENEETCAVYRGNLEKVKEYFIREEARSLDQPVEEVAPMVDERYKFEEFGVLTTGRKK